METLMVDRVQSSLRLFMYRNALFLCERLCAEFPSELNLQLLATCYLRNNQAYCAYHILKGSKMPQSRYLFAISCFQMNLLREAETALCPANEPNAEVPNGAAGHYLLGLIYRYTGRRTCAVDHFMQALAIDPLLWAAYEELCILGAAEEASECFNDAAAFRVQQQQLSESSSQNLTIGTECQSLPSSMALGSGDTSPRHSKQLHANNTRETLSHPHGTVMVAGHPPIGGPSNISQYYTPPAVTQLSGVAPPPLCRNAQLYLNAIGGDGYTKSNVNAVIQAPRRKFVDEGKLRKVSGRLFSDSGTRRSTRLSGEAAANTNSNASQLGGNGANHFSAKSLGGLSSSSSKTNSAVLRSVTLRRGQSWANENFDEDNTVTTSSMSALADGKCLEQDKMGCGISAHDSRLASGIREFLGLLRTLGEGYRLSCLYRSQEALEVYLRLSQHQFNTGWVLSQVGKAHFELVDYFEADRFFDLARRVSPYTLEGMDIYSTVLYHLEEEMKLSYLAQELISVDRLSPQAWCAMGNCYSLQKDHETAVKNFQRAVHVDSRFAYAHTLCGHEYVALEDFENGIKCYQSALQVDERHYNAWYGLGVVYLRQEKFEFAEHHFRKAFHINPCSSVLMCYLGMALHSLKRDEEALEIMEKAISADKKNPLPMYQKANILSSLERFDEALKELEQLKEYAPRESSVYALMGKIYKRLNVHEKAMFYFGIALDLKPPAADVATIKSAMEKLYLPDELEDTL
ncbi:cell division cycle protein 27 homolog B isoform X2 [Elaeis guineensis]|uniref:Cell division cycle protein 27 homolog B isoform X2 n=1 Tax=Elaeis guineensis var. tenera TaxID=51953 RepID=A0A6I9QVB1_ELAGV|nr:cell division cycle protein 27 homolog B isoform X2 [Elaeis guineensis]